MWKTNIYFQVYNNSDVREIAKLVSETVGGYKLRLEVYESRSCHRCSELSRHQETPSASHAAYSTRDCLPYARPHTIGTYSLYHIYCHIALPLMHMTHPHYPSQLLAEIKPSVRRFTTSRKRPDISPVSCPHNECSGGQ
ncbi:hypothetical protein J6590_084400 [Homalodisca vitripennis]|nr:hypothetical protein J6590_084400 [Homalodisca vitripennis]